MSKPIRTLTLTVQFTEPAHVETALYKVLNEIRSDKSHGREEINGGAFEYVIDSYTKEAFTNGAVEVIFQSKMNE